MVQRPAPEDETGLKTVDKAFRILEYIKRENGATLTQIANQFELAKSTVHRYLQTLLSHGYIILEDDEYQIGLRFLDPAMYARTRRDEYTVIESKIETLAEESGERAQFITEENGVGIHVFSAIGESGIESESRVGKLVYLHATSAGKAILAHLEEERVEEILDQTGLPELTDRTITDRAEFKNELEQVKQRGYAVNRAERREGMQAIGAPVIAPDGKVLGAISVTGPLRRMQSEHEDYLPDRLLDLAEEIRLRLEYQD